MQIYLDIFKNSLKLPQRKAAFSLNRIGMDKIIVYLSFMIAILSIPGLIEQINANDKSSVTYVQTFFLLIFFFMFYYLITLLGLFIVLSLIAYIGSWIAKWTNRKLRYSILWKMAACITTIPIIVFTIIAFFHPLSILFLLYALLFHFIVFLRTIFIYPKRRKRGK